MVASHVTPPLLVLSPAFTFGEMTLEASTLPSGLDTRMRNPKNWPGRDIAIVCVVEVESVLGLLLLLSSETPSIVTVVSELARSPELSLE